jgi:hypothetical protein
MKAVFSLVLTAAVLSQDAPSPVQNLRAALGGNAALSAIQRLHVKASFAGDARGQGDTDSYVALPDRFLEQVHSVQLHAAYPTHIRNPGDPIEDYLTTSRVEGFVGPTPLFNGQPAPKSWKSDGLERSLQAGRFQYARLLIPLLGTVPTVRSAHAVPGGIVLQDGDFTTWTITLDASGLPASMAVDRRPGEGGSRLPSPVSTFGDYRRVAGGMMWPHKVVTTIDGRIIETTWVKSYEINGKVPKVLTK